VLTLIRAQLRLGLVVALCFAVTLALAAICLAVVPLFGELTVLDVPVSWVLQAYGMYPLVVVFALIYVRGARRNEQRYRSLEQNR
jgi:membrane protein implicated in regulation of membrane protease activity